MQLCSFSLAEEGLFRRKLEIKGRDIEFWERKGGERGGKDRLDWDERKGSGGTAFVYILYSQKLYMSYDQEYASAENFCAKSPRINRLRIMHFHLASSTFPLSKKLLVESELCSLSHESFIETGDQSFFASIATMFFTVSFLTILL